MKENADKHLDDLSRKVIGKSALENTSFEFTQKVMSQINALSSSKATTYVPLISKRIWMFIVFGFVSIVVYSVFMFPDDNQSWVNKLNLNQMQLPSFNIPQITVYAILLLAIMLCIQIPLLKYYFNKRLG